MITQDDIDAFIDETTFSKAPEAAVKKIRDAAENLAYEFNPEYLYDLLVLASRLGVYVANEQLMQISYQAEKIWLKEHNE